MILSGLFSEVRKTRDGVGEWKAILLSLFFLLMTVKDINISIKIRGDSSLR